MAGRPADELWEIYQELTQPCHHDNTDATLQPSWHHSAALRFTSGRTPPTAVGIPFCKGRPVAAFPSLPMNCREACEGVSGSSEHTSTSGQNVMRRSSVSMGLVDSFSGSAGKGNRPSWTNQSNRNGLESNMSLPEAMASKLPDAGGVNTTRSGLFFCTPTEYRWICWLCETPCARPGWLNAPELYVGEEEGVDMDDYIHHSHSHHHLPVTLLTLCSRCSAACSLPADASHAAVLRKAGATRVLLQRTEMFVHFLRGFKRLLESLATKIEELAVLDARVYTGATRSSLWDFHPDFQSSVIHQLIDMLTSTLEADSLQSRRQQVDVLSAHERLLLEEEHVWLQRQLSTIEENGPSPMWLLRTAVAPLSTAEKGIMSHDVSHAPQHGAQDEGRKLHAQLRLCFPSAKTEPGGWRHDQRNPVVHGGEGSEEALQKMMERALTARWHHLDEGSASLANVTETPNTKDEKKEKLQIPSPTFVSLPKDAGGVGARLIHDDPDNILLHYFEGRLEDLPKFKLLSVDATRGGGNNACLPQPFRHPPGTHRSSCGNSANVSSDVVLVATDAAAAASMDAEGLLKQLREEQKRREESEAALRESHQKIAALEKATDHISGLALDLEYVLEEQLERMWRFLRKTSQSCMDVMMQKSLFFSDEMAALMRQAQRQAYGVNGMFPPTHAGTAVEAHRDLPSPGTRDIAEWCVCRLQC
ncbi:hypothetical protein MOQ_009658 [Trypanosoma cruzi marinkellei]|uniref:Uncharacterized protein n=1 Tax=Trypanosoma cruzi marinkellei TaxID=85056 RepID=K2NCA4_TRYCR|nr:hypothetical protein MOQ_009658 [Trypanosoma cruzi marinkellei]